MILGERVRDTYEIFKNKDGFVDKYQVLASFALLNGDELENRAQFIFRMFDFDGSHNIDLNEFILSASSAINGLCRVAGLKNSPTKK
jgi:Ca2+-binding EF-hand superfamily protein